MDISRVKYNLNQPVRYGSSLYRFSGCILKAGQNGFYYTAELTDLTARSSLTYCRLDEIEEVKEKS